MNITTANADSKTLLK